MKNHKIIDELIAEKIMGFKKIKVKWESGIHRGYRDTWINGKQIEFGDIPNYSTDISAAWKVMEKLIEDHGLVYLVSFPDYMGVNESAYKARWEVRLDQSKFLFLTPADTAPLAICLASLKMAGVNYD